MNATDRDLRTTDARRLRELAADLKADAKALYPHNTPEAMRLFRLFMRLFRLFMRITTELHRRRNPALAPFQN